MDNEDFQARIVVKMRVARRDYELVIRMLKFSQLLRDPVGVMVVDKRDRTDYRRIGIGRLLCDQAIAD